MSKVDTPLFDYDALHALRRMMPILITIGLGKETIPHFIFDSENPLLVITSTHLSLKLEFKEWCTIYGVVKNTDNVYTLPSENVKTLFLLRWP